MPSALQQRSARNKLIYFGLILGLFVVNTFFWRGVASPLSAGEPPPWTIAAQAKELELTEVEQGEADLIGSTIRLGLTGSRGLAVSVLWNAAIEKQKKNEWNELEFIVRSLTKLQPHFLTPWLFQSWNLAYNVSVENDRVADKFFYISRGIELLAQGERVNRDNPDMRYWLGFYYQNKFGVSDENNTLKCLFQLSCIEPSQRDANVLRPGGKIDLDAFERFCRAHPQLVRRLRTFVLKPNAPGDVIDFLADNRKIPCRYVDPTIDTGLRAGRPGELKPVDQQFPVLPERKARSSPLDEPTASDTFDDSFCNFQAARAWLAYSQDPLPDPEPMYEFKERRERLALMKGKRLPRQPAEVIFRQGPPRAQSYIGERLIKEGWFDESGWAVDANRSGLSRWFPPGRDVVVGTGVSWCKDAWERAYLMWREYGRQNGLYLEPNELARLQEEAELIRRHFNLRENESAEGYRVELLEDPRLRASLIAHRKLYYRNQNLSLANFSHHYYRADAERDRDAIEARKLIYEADQLRRAAEPERAIAMYLKAFDVWKQFLARDRYREFRSDSETQGDTYEAELRYLELLRDHRGAQLRPALAAQGALAEGAATLAGGGAFPGQQAVGLLYALVTDSRSLPVPVVGPFDGNGPDGKPWIPHDVINDVRSRLNLDLPVQPQAPASQPEKLEQVKPGQPTPTKG